MGIVYAYCGPIILVLYKISVVLAVVTLSFDPCYTTTHLLHPYSSLLSKTSLFSKINLMC